VHWPELLGSRLQPTPSAGEVLTRAPTAANLGEKEFRLLKIHTKKEKGTSMARKHTKNKPQTFSITAPDARTVMLVGDFTNWQERPIQLKKAAGGAWSVDVELAPGTHQYRFIVDGQWREDPACAQHAPNPYGTQNSVRQVA
jgi:1,4-alpha-glucan branching enzyme